MATENVEAWSTTAATNATADTGINWAEGQDPATVNNSARGMMAAIAKQSDDQGGALAAGGTTNALTVTTGQVLASGQVTAGLRLLLRATADNTSATVTFAPDGLTAANIKRADGSALAVGSIKSGMYLDLVYNSGSSEWRCANIAPASSSAGAFGAAQASFSANKGGVNQTISTAASTQVTFGTEAYDVGGYFASNAWTPPAGTILLSAFINFSSVTAGSTISLYIRKNASDYAVFAGVSESALGFSLSGVAMDQANGTDVYTVFVSSSDTSYVLDGGAINTRFQGSMI